jgi:hypothetical protein
VIRAQTGQNYGLASGPRELAIEHRASIRQRWRSFIKIFPLTDLRLSGYRGRGNPLAFPFGATKRAHCRIMAQKAEIVQVMMTTFFITRNLCKHWLKLLSNIQMSSMYS